MDSELASIHVKTMFSRTQDFKLGFSFQKMSEKSLKIVQLLQPNLSLIWSHYQCDTNNNIES